MISSSEWKWNCLSVCLSLLHISLWWAANLKRIDTCVSRDITETNCRDGLRIELSVKTNQWCIINMPRRLTPIYTWFTTSIAKYDINRTSRCALLFPFSCPWRRAPLSNRIASLALVHGHIAWWMLFHKRSNKFSLIVTFLTWHYPRKCLCLSACLGIFSCYQIEDGDAIGTGVIDYDHGSFTFPLIGMILI